MNRELRKKAKSNFERNFFKQMNNSIFDKAMENVRKYRDIKLVATEKRRKYLVPKPNHHKTKFFSKQLLAIEMKKTEILKSALNKPVYLGLSI